MDDSGLKLRFVRITAEEFLVQGKNIPITLDDLFSD